MSKNDLLTAVLQEIYTEDYKKLELSPNMSECARAIIAAIRAAQDSKGRNDIKI